MKSDPLFLKNERLFNSVEVELIRRWAFGQVPVMFGNQEASVLKCFIKAWWHLYHESTCAMSETNRTIWERDNLLPAPALESKALLEALLHIRQLIALEALRQYRQIRQFEESALGGLNVLIHYYMHLDQAACAGLHPERAA